MMRHKIFILYFLFFLSTSFVFAQQVHPAGSTDTMSSSLRFTPVLSAFLSDTTLRNYKMESTLMTLEPNAIDTVSHRHDGDLFGFVLEGAVQIGLEYKAPITYVAGQMFFEKRNTLHTLARNHLENGETKILLFYILKEGRKNYIPLHVEQ